MGTLAQNLQSNADRLQELTATFDQAANNNRWGDLRAILPQIQDIVAGTAIQLGEMEPNAIPAMLVASRASVDMLEDALRQRDEKAAAEMEAQMKAGQVSDTPSDI